LHYIIATHVTTQLDYHDHITRVGFVSNTMVFLSPSRGREPESTKVLAGSFDGQVGDVESVHHIAFMATGIGAGVADRPILISFDCPLLGEQTQTAEGDLAGSPTRRRWRYVHRPDRPATCPAQHEDLRGLLFG